MFLLSKFDYYSRINSFQSIEFFKDKQNQVWHRKPDYRPLWIFLLKKNKRVDSLPLVSETLPALIPT